MQTIKRKCQNSACDNDAVYSVHLSLAVHENHEPAISTPIVFVCNQHKDHVTWDNFVEPNWDKICQSIESFGRKAPIKEFSKLIIKPVTNGENYKGGYN